jgi:hypothetical protein
MRNKIIFSVLGAIALVCGVAYAAGGWTAWQVYVQNGFAVANTARTGTSTFGTTAIATDVLHIDGIASQTADYIEVDNSSGTVQFKIASDGLVQFVSKTANPCIAGTSAGRIFYNATDKIMCYCGGGSGATLGRHALEIDASSDDCF